MVQILVRVLPVLVALLIAWHHESLPPGPSKQLFTKSLSMIQLKPELSKSEVEVEQTPYTPVAMQKTMPGASAKTMSPSSGCPHEEAGLMPFNDFLASRDASGDLSISSGRYLLSNSVTIGSLTIESGAELIVADVAGLSLETRAIYVRGALRLGSATCPMKAGGLTVTFTGSGDKSSRSTNPLDTKGLVVGNGGILEVFGTRYWPTWTRLSASAPPGATQLSLADEVDWKVGQKVVVITTAYTDDPNDHQNEVREIAAVSGSKVTLTQGLQFGHYGGPEYAAEVALLSRTVTFQGDAASESTRYGGHIMCVPGSQCRVAGAMAYRMGQENVMGRYPLHFHMMGKVNGDSFFEDCLVQHSYFRAYTVHGTSNSRVSRNVAYDISGSAYYLEDGNERDNLFDFNLAAFILIIDQLNDYGGGGQGGVRIHTQPSRIVPTDATAVGFYCTNAKNRWIGNSASGGFSGFHFPRVPYVLGDSYAQNKDYHPDEEELGEFDSNTAHSSGRLWSRGGCMYVGGELWEDNKGSHDYSYVSGRTSTRKGGRFFMTNTKVFACRKGILFWGAAGWPHLGLEGFEAHDISRASTQLGDTYMWRAVISAHTGNTFATDLPKVTDGFELYDTGMQTILSEVTWRNFDRNGDVAIMDMTHSNIFKPAGMFNTRAIYFEGTPMAQRLRHVERRACTSFHQDTCKNRCDFCPGTPGSSQISNMFDADGTLVGWDEPAIIGADDEDSETNYRTNEWWHIDDSCQRNLDWGFWICPTKGHRTIVSLFIMKGNHDKYPQRTDPNTAVGKVYHFGHEERHLDLGLAESPMVTGPCCDVGWFLALDKGAERDLTITMDQMVPEGGLIFATAYPIGASLTVSRCMPHCATMRQGSSMQDVLDAPEGDVFFVDGVGRLFLKFVYADNGFFEFAGVKQLINSHRYYAGKGLRYKITSSRTGSVGALQLPPPLDGSSISTTRSSSTTEWSRTTEVTTTTGDVSGCSGKFGGCLSSLCCKDAGWRCYEKDEYWAQCRETCTPGINPNEEPQYQTPWSCNILGLTTEPATTTTTGISTTTSTSVASTTTSMATTVTTTMAVTTTMTTTTVTTAGSFIPVDGGVDRVCRGDSSSDNDDSYYIFHSGIGSIADCKLLCLNTNGCKGIEYGSKKCEVWIRPGGIRATKTLTGYTCLRYTGPQTTTTTTTTTTTATSTTSAPVLEFRPVDGGQGRACRGDSPGDNSASYYQVSNDASLQGCQSQCKLTDGCTGIEYHERGRCEIWTRPEGVHASIALDGYTCLSYGTPIPQGIFEDVDGGVDRVCRGGHPNDNSASYFTVAQASSLEGCKFLCVKAADCKGIEYHTGGRCEIWTRAAGIEASRQASDYTCLRYMGLEA